MEKTTENNNKHSKLRNKFMKIATAAIAVTFHNPPFSPGRSSSSSSDHKFRSSQGGTKGVGGVSMIPRTKHHKETQTTTQEPTSPKISCMGQIKHKKKHHQHMIPTTKPTRVVNNSTTASSSPPTDTADQLKKHGGGSTSNRFQRMNFFLRTRSARRKPDDVSLASAVGEDDRSAPPMGEMRRFASGREAFSNFNWKSVEETDQREYCYSEAEEEDDNDIINEILIPFSAPINRGGATSNYMPNNLRPRKEINLWKRRTMAPPRPLQVNPLLTAR